MGWDLRYKSFVNSFIVGFSGYSSSLGSTKTTSTVELGEGPPKGGILFWMEGDRFVVAGVFLEKQPGKLLIQTEYYNAVHDAVRNPEAVLDVIQNANINDAQRDRAGDEEAGLADNGIFWKPSAGLVYRPLPNVAIKLDGSYHVQKFNGPNVAYPELRLDFSFAFSNNQIEKALGNWE
jgi:hypothetical protein